MTAAGAASALPRGPRSAREAVHLRCGAGRDIARRWQAQRLTTQQLGRGRVHRLCQCLRRTGLGVRIGIRARGQDLDKLVVERRHLGAELLIPLGM
jgi:hypothetical protein